MAPSELGKAICAGEGKPEFQFAHVEYQWPVTHLGGDVKWAPGYSSPGSQQRFGWRNPSQRWNLRHTADEIDHFTMCCINSHSLNDIIRQVLLSSPFTDKETEADRGK